MSKIFTTHDFNKNLIQRKPEETKVYEILKSKMTDFDTKVYQNGLHKAVNECMIKGMSGQFDNVNLYVYTIANKVLITFVNIKKKRQVSFVGNWDRNSKEYASWGIQSIESDLENATKMIDVVSENWDSRKIKPDTTIAIG